MASIRKRDAPAGPRWDVVVDLGPDPRTGKRRQRTRTFKTSRAAQRFATAWQAEIDRGTAIDRSDQTLGTFLDYWLETYARHHVRATTFVTYERAIRTHLIPGLGHVPLQKLTPQQVQQWYADKSASYNGRRVKGGSVARFCALRLKQVLKMAVRQGLVARNVADLVPMPPEQEHEMLVWSRDEVRQFVRAAEGTRFGALYILLVATGIRRGEGLGLRWADVDWVDGALSIIQSSVPVYNKPVLGPTKTRKGRRTISVGPGVLAVLRGVRARQDAWRAIAGRHWAERGLIFTNELGGLVVPAAVSKEYDKVMAQASVTRIRVHDLRHTFATHALADGMQAHIVAEHLGHADVALTLRVYAHILPRQRAEMAAFGDALVFGPEKPM